MRITTVLFDLDGTLLPMDQDKFVSSYFSRLAKALAPHGYDPEKLIAAIWKGTKAMIGNNGEKTNERAFWDTFCAIFGPEAMNDEPRFTAFYESDFQQVQNDCGFTPDAAKVISHLKRAGYRLALATNPIFPAIATQSRIRWAGLSPEDFELYTTYENCRFTKPNLSYYQDILSAMGVDPQECLMVGNDVSEDMVARQLGMQVYLVTDCLINAKNEDISHYPHGPLSQVLSLLS